MIKSLKKLWLMLSPAQHRSAMILLGLMVIGMVMETLGISLIIPIIALMTKGDLSSDYPMLIPWLEFLGNPSQKELIIFSMLILAGVYFVKVVFLVFLVWLQARFLSWVNSDFSLRLYTSYLRQPYAFHLKRNSVELIRNAINQTSQVAGAIQSYLAIATEFFILFGILALMLVVEFVGTLMVLSVFGLASWGFYSFTRRRIRLWGEEYQNHDKLRLQYLREGLGAAKDVKLLGREKEFLDRYQLHNLGSAQISKKRSVLTALPRFWLEILGVTGIVSVVLLMITQNRSMESLVPTLGVFAVAAFRLMPSANRFLNATQNVRFLSAAFNNLHQEFSLLEQAEYQKEYSSLTFDEALVLENVSFCYPSTEALVLKQISLSIRQGESVGFIGSTGAGKSTLVDIILGLLVPTSGVVKVDGIDIQTSPRGWQDRIGYVPQSIFLTDDTIRNNIAFGLPRDQIDDAAVWNSLCSAQLDQFVKGLPGGLDAQIGEGGVRLSGGQRQRIGIARALYYNPSVLVLDEATSSLDTITESDFIDAICALKGDKTLIIVAHRLTTIEHCDYLFKLGDGEIVEEGKVSILLGKKYNSL
jgi:ABC-type multidrug transport system fused ATPase/permease subunit